MKAQTFVYDSGALIAIDKRRGRALQQHEKRLADGHRIIVPAPVAAQLVRRPPRQARLVSTLRGCVIAPFEEDHVSPVGRLLADAGTADVVDGFVVVTAAVADASTVVTSDRDDIRHLADTLRFPVSLVEP